MNVSAIVDLKAELFRKQEELRQQKSTSTDGNYIKGTTVQPKTNIWSKKNAGVLERAQRDLEVKEEEENIFDKSKKSLQAKAQLYDSICKGSNIPEEDGSGTYLVDFQKKFIDTIKEKQEKTKTDNEQKMPEQELSFEKDSTSPEEQWVDYVDSLGRSRRCMKKDLSELQRRDKELSCKNRENVSNYDSTSNETDVPTLMSNDMRQALQQKWEKQEEETENQPTHYSNVRFDEIRNHGVGYYQFSRNEETRHEEMKILEKLREQTVDERSRSERLKEKRKAMLNARLAKVKQRRTMKPGLLGVEGDDSLEEEIGPKSEKLLGQTGENKKEVELLTRDDSWRKGHPVREWDKGKESMPIFSAEKYSEDRRKERIEEFAPPSFYKNESALKHPVKVFKSKANDSTCKEAAIEITQDKNILKITKPVEPSMDVSDIPLPANVSKIPSASEVMQTNIEVGAYPYSQSSTQSLYHYQPNHSDYDQNVSPACRLNSQYLPGSYTTSQSCTWTAPAAEPPSAAVAATTAYSSHGYFNQSLNPSDGTLLNITGNINSQATFDHCVSSIDSRHCASIRSESVLKENVEHRTALSKINIVDERHIQNEMASEAVDGDVLPSIEAVAYEAGSYTEAMNLSRIGKRQTADPTKPNYNGGAVLYSQQPADSNSGQITKDTIDIFLDTIKKEAQK